MATPILIRGGIAVSLISPDVARGSAGVAVLSVSCTDPNGREIDGFFCFEIPEGAIILHPVIRPYCSGAQVMAEMPDGNRIECREISPNYPIVIGHRHRQNWPKVIAESASIRARWS